MFVLIQHPIEGVMLYDTGYSTRFYEVTRKFPYRIMQWFTPAIIRPEEDADVQLQAGGVSKDDISKIILSHCHVDHTCALNRFPGAEVIVSGKEWEWAWASPRKAFSHGFIKELYDHVQPEKVREIDFNQEGRPYGIFPQAVDLFSDGSMIAVPLPGHTIGNMGLLVNTKEQRFFFIGDAAWIRRNYLEQKPAIWLTKLFIYSSSEMMESLKRINQLAAAHPEIIIVPAHDPETWSDVCAKGLNWPVA